MSGSTSPAQDRRGAVFVMPRRSTEWRDAAALWVTVAGWAKAARRRFGAAWVVTPDGVWQAEDVLAFTAAEAAARAPRHRSPLSTNVGTLAKDVLRARTRAWVPNRDDWGNTSVQFIWQHHDLFHRGGVKLARRLGCPVVSYVHAPQVWEARRWGVRRPGWGPLLERWGERPQLLASDVVACVSDEVRQEVVERFGVPPDRTVVSPMAVDADEFSPAVSGDGVRGRHGLGRAFVVGWTGSFRRFHGLELALEAFAALHAGRGDGRLLLVGDGPERAVLARRAEDLGIADAVVFPGAVRHDEVASYVAAMDATLVLARSGQDFHYSPLKLREYLACGKAVVAPCIGEIPRVLENGESGLLYAPGSMAELAASLRTLADDGALRERLGAAGRALVMSEYTWDAQLEHLMARFAFLDAGRALGAATDSG